MSEFTQTPRTTLHRYPNRGSYDKKEAFGILDHNLICHVSFIQDNLPRIIPMAYCRVEDHLYIHGSKASPAMASILENKTVCVSVTHVDALVLAKSAFHHSLNYRSVILFGTPALITNAIEKTNVMKAFLEHVVPGRWEKVRAIKESEIHQTSILQIPIVEASVKIRKGPPVDDPKDADLPIWSGLIPLVQQWGDLICDASSENLEKPEVHPPLLK